MGFFKRMTPSKIIAIILLLILSVIMIYPLVMVLNLSFLTDKAFLRNPMQFVSKDTFTFKNYSDVVDRLHIVTRFINTVWMTAAACAISIIVSMLAAFPISRGHYKSSKGAYTFVMASMFFPGSLIANIVLLDRILNIYGTPICLILIWAIGNIQMNIFMMVGFIKQLPRDLDGSAMIDGCGYFRYILTIVLPLMTPIISTIFVFIAVGCWNDFIGPMIYLKGNTFVTLSVGLYFFRGTYASKWNKYSAAIMIIALPMIILYIFMQKYIIEGMTSGALKG